MTTKMKRIVILAIDESPHSQRAFHWYLDNVRKEEDQLLLFHVYDFPKNFSPLGISQLALVTEYHDFLQEKVRESECLIQSFREQCELKNIKNFEFVNVLGGHSGEHIIQAVKKHNASLIVLGCRGMGTIGRLFRGSVSEYVLHHSHIPCIICPPGDDANAEYYTQEEHDAFFAKTGNTKHPGPLKSQ